MIQGPSEARQSADGAGRGNAASPARRVSAAVLLVVFAGTLALSIAVAQAGKGVVHVFGSQGSGDGQFNVPRDVAVYEATGDIYVADDNNHRIQRFDASGTYEAQWGGLGTAEGQFDNPTGIAIDQDTGDVFVQDRDNRRVQRFDADGNFERMWGWGVDDGTAAFQICTGGCQTGIAGAGDGQLGATVFAPRLAVSPPDGNASNGNVYVADPGTAANRRVLEFDLQGNRVSMFGATGTADGQFGANQPLHVAVDSAGMVYISDSNSSNRVQRYNTATDAFIAPIGVPPLLNAVTVGLEVDPDSDAGGPDSDQLYVARDPSTGETVVQELASPGGTTPTVFDTHASGAGLTTTVNGTGINTASDRLYLSNIASSTEHRVLVLDDVGGVPPTVTIEPVENIGTHGATFKGRINPNGSLTAYHFDYSSTGPTGPWTPFPANDVTIGAGTSEVAVDEDVTGLDSNTDYHVRLVAGQPFGPHDSVTSGVVSFKTRAALPTVVSAGATPAATTAVLRGRIHPQNSPTTYHFEYGTDTSYGTTVPVPDGCAVLLPGGCVAPDPDGDADGDGDIDDTDGDGIPDRDELKTVQSVTQPIAALVPGTTYHFRLVATNAAGTTHGPDQTFTTHSGQPVAERAYEMVSPLEKNGNDADPNVFFGLNDDQFGIGARASADGDAVAWASQASFGDANGATLPGFYLSRRVPPSWSTQSMMPPQGIVTPSGSSPAVDLVSDDLSKSVAFTAEALTSDAPALGNKLYLRDNPSGTYRLIGSGPPKETPSSFDIQGIDADPDLEHILFETEAVLTSDAPATGLKLYRWDDGTLSLASILPGDVPAQASAGEFGSGPLEIAENTISDDGSVVIFTAPAHPNLGALYRREGGTTTQVAPAGARFRGATPDGSKVLYVLPATNGELFLYDHTDGSTTHLSADNEPAPPNGAAVPGGGGVLGMNDAGTRVYFAAANQIVDGEPSGQPMKLYVWDADDGVRYVGGMSNASDEGANAWDAFGSEGAVLRDVSANGATLLLRSATALTSDANGAPPQVYLYDYGADELTCVSCPAGGTPIGQARLDRRSLYTNAGLLRPRGRRNVSDDGRRAFFTTPSRLVPEDTNGDIDVYMWEDGSPHLISSGKGNFTSEFTDASANGDTVFFSTIERLVGWDTDSLRDVYAARIGGGLPEPPAVTPPCVADQCQGLPSGLPSLLSPASNVFMGLGDLASRPRPSFSVRRLSKAQRAKLAQGRAVPLVVRVNRRGRVALVGRAKLGGRSKVVARKSKMARRPGTVKLPLKLSEAARGRLDRMGRLRVTLSVRFAGVREPRTLGLRLSSGRGR
jgi:NHL repeat